MPHVQDAGEEPSGYPTAGMVLRVRGLRKRFGSLRVLRGIDLDLRTGEILALVGENGAGKSTLVQCLAGAAKADGGRIELQANGTDPGSGRPSRIAVVWQDLALCDNLSAIANLFLGNERLHNRLLDEAAMASIDAVARRGRSTRV